MNFLKSIPVPVRYALLALVLFWAAFLFGRYTVPTRVEIVEKEKIVEKVVEKIDEKKLSELVEQNKQFREQLTELKKSIHRVRWEKTNADGSKEKTETLDINVSKVVKEQEIKFVDREVKVTETKIVDRVVDRIVEVEKLKVVTAEKAQWHAAALLGIGPTISVGATAPYIDPLLVGARVERRIAGPFFVGGWVTTPIQRVAPTGGLSVGFEF